MPVYKTHQLNLFISKSSRANPDSVASWQNGNESRTMEHYFGLIRDDFGQSIYDEVGSSNLPIEDYAIGDSVKIRFDVNNPNQFVYDVPSEIYLPLQKTLVLLVFLGGFLLYMISQFFY